MAPVIWGLDLKEMQWYKFGNNYMFKNRDYHLRRTKFIVYQLALIFCVVSESLGTAALSDYIDEQKHVKFLNPNAYVYNNDYVGAASYNIFAGVFVAFIFGAAFFFDLFWPERHESKSVRIAWKVCGVLAVIFHLAAALELTVITATHAGYVTGVSQQEGARLVAQFTKDPTPLVYRHNPRALAAVVFVWLGWASIVPSCILLFMSIDHTEKGPGPKTAHTEDREAAHLRANTSSAERDIEKEKPLEAPEPAYQQPNVQAGAEDETPYYTPAAEIPPHTTSLQNPDPIWDTFGAAEYSEVTLGTIESTPTVDSDFSALAKKSAAGSNGHGGRELLRNRSWAALTSGVADSGWGSR